MEHVLDFASRWRNQCQYDRLMPLSASVGPNSLSCPFTYFTPMLLFILLNACAKVFKYIQSLRNDIIISMKISCMKKKRISSPVTDYVSSPYEMIYLYLFFCFAMTLAWAPT